MAKTPEYTKKAIQNYNNKFDRVAVNLPKGTKDKIRELTGKSCNAYVSEIVLKDLEKLENNAGDDMQINEQKIKLSPDLEELQKELENKRKELGIVAHEETEEERKKRVMGKFFP